MAAGTAYGPRASSCAKAKALGCRYEALTAWKSWILCWLEVRKAECSAKAAEEAKETGQAEAKKKAAAQQKREEAEAKQKANAQKWTVHTGHKKLNIGTESILLFHELRQDENLFALFLARAC